MHLKKRLLLSYLLIAYVFVQSISGFVHMHTHAYDKDPGVAHHHYPAVSAFHNNQNITGDSDDLIEFNLQSDGLFSSQVFSPLLAIILLITILPLFAVSTTRLFYFSTIYPPLTQRLQYQSPPLRAPPLLQI